MSVTVKEYLTYFRHREYPNFIAKEDLEKLENVERIFGELETKETILEICLSKKDTGCDYSIRIDVDSPYVKEYWYELDSDACSKEDIPACYFIDASKVIPGEDNHIFYDTVLVQLIGEERLSRLRSQLELCVAKLKGKSNKLFQLGTMTGRQELDRIRFFTDDLTRTNFVNYLKELNWKGNLKALDTFLEQWESYSDGKKFILDFDILEDGISEKIGICFGTVSKSPQVIDEFLTELQSKGLCMQEKKEDVLRFIQAFPSHTPFIQNDISHFKIPFLKDVPLMAKAYLRQGSVCFYNEFQAYDTPVLMNLELTTRCPLRCPQCYCDLTKGKDMELETALYWLKEAAKNRVKTINLSGGETMLYPHLSKLIQTCNELGMESNIALSGYGVDKKVLEKLILDGVSGIFISLNGSTEEINAHSRDGYSLAIRALEVLDEIGYKKTCINWVMHSNNTDDFLNMIRLAEKYHVAEIEVMVFKPDTAHQRESIPSKEQILQIAKQIKEYKGTVHIRAEECFSQLRVVLGQRFFTNLNRGIAKGCGAGRDGISISVDGKITPCRHIEIKEEYKTIREYWDNSIVLKQLRQMEEKMEEPCAACNYKKYCLPCAAVNWKMKGRIFMGEESCRLGKRK